MGNVLNAYDATEDLLRYMHQVAENDSQRQALDSIMLVIRTLRSHVTDLWHASNQLQAAYLAQVMPAGHPEMPADVADMLEDATTTLMVTRQLFTMADPRHDAWQWT
jgi:hypothetical protein